MRTADMNFIETRRYLLPWTMLLLAGAALAAMLLYYQSLQNRIAALQQAQPTVLSQPSQALTPTLQYAYQNAQQTRNALNVPWLQTLAALEAVQSRNPGIYLLSMQPNRAKAEILLNGEARDFAALNQYLIALQQQALFTDATLLNQRLVVSETVNDKLGFTISVTWRCCASN